MKNLILLLIFIGFISSCEKPDSTEKSSDLSWVSIRDLTSNQFSDKFDYYRRQGYIIKDVDVYPNGDNLRYSLIWEENKDNRKWAEWRNLTSDGYHDKWKQYKKEGYRPTDVEGYLSNGQLRFAGIWEENIESIDWYSYRNLTSSEYGDIFKDKEEKGYRVVDIEAYQTRNGIRYACIWYKNNSNIEWYQYRDMNRSTYQQKADQLSAENYRVIDFESYTVDGNQKYAAIWEKNINDHAYQVRSDRSELEYANLWRKYRDQGYRIIDFERYETPNGTRYAGVWTENAERYRWKKKGAIDDLIVNYRNNNDIPGISVAIVHQGKLVYQRGFGKADVKAGKDAHGKSVYLLASISKVIGGTLATKLESKGQLENGTPVNLNLTNTTRTYLPEMALSHTHTVEQLLAHLGCIWHYDGPEPPEGHYSTARAAAKEIWDTSPISNCKIGSDWKYSTHAFTFVGAVLEEVTNRSIVQLIKEEISRPNDLNSIRVQYSDPDLPGNYERVVPYDSNKNGSTYEDNSWKVLGGGIEGDAVDLAWFGWKVLDGQIVDATTRDNKLWTRVIPTEKNGLAWVLKSEEGRNIAEHGGIWSGGARTHLRVYRDHRDKLVITVLTNLADNTPAKLVTDIGNEILNP